MPIKATLRRSAERKALTSGETSVEGLWSPLIAASADQGQVFWSLFDNDQCQFLQVKLNGSLNELYMRRSTVKSEIKLLVATAAIALMTGASATVPASSQCADKVTQAGPLGDPDRRDPHTDRVAQDEPRDPHSSHFAQDEPRDPYSSHFAQDEPRDPHSSHFAQDEPRDPHSSHFAQDEPRDPHSSHFVQDEPRDPHSSHFVQANPDQRDPHDSRFAAAPNAGCN